MNNKVGNHAAIVRQHARAIGIEDARHFDAKIMLAVVVEEKCFGAALAFVIARPRTNWINVSIVALDLGMTVWVAVNLAGRCLQNFSFGPIDVDLGEAYTRWNLGLNRIIGQDFTDDDNGDS